MNYGGSNYGWNNPGWNNPGWNNRGWNNPYYGSPNNRGGLVGGDDPGVGGGFGRVSYGPTGAWGTGWGGWGTQASYAGPAYAGPAYAGASGWYLKGGVMACTSGMWVTGGNGLPFRCP